MTDRRADTPEYEAKCLRCGICCRGGVSLPDGRQVVARGLACCYFGTRESDGHSECRVYEDRFEKASWCLHSSEAVKSGGLSHSCPYRTKNDPRGKEILSDDEYEKAWPLISAVILACPNLEPGLDWSAFCQEANKTDLGGVWKAKFDAGRTKVTVTREPSFMAKLWKRGEI